MELTEYKDTQLDRTDPNSIISKIQGATKIEEALARVFVSKEYSELRSEREFKVAFGSDKNFKTLKHIRFAFWNEYNYSVDNNKKMSINRLIGGVCRSTDFYNYIKDDLYLTFILTAPTSIQLVQQELIQIGYEQMEEILNIPTIDDDGRVNTNLIKEKVKILENLENRRWGGVVHRAQIHNKTDVTTEQKESTNESVDKQLLLERVKKLELELGHPASSALEVEYKEV